MFLRHVVSLDLCLYFPDTSLPLCWTSSKPESRDGCGTTCSLERIDGNAYATRDPLARTHLIKSDPLGLGPERVSFRFGLYPDRSDCHQFRI